MAELKPCKFEVGETVSLWKWDRYERATNKLGQCEVKFIERTYCETGYMVTVENANGARCTLASNWLAKIIPEHPELAL